MEMKCTFPQAQKLQGYRGAFSTESCCFTDSQTRSGFFFPQKTVARTRVPGGKKSFCVLSLPVHGTAEVTRKERGAGADPLTILASTHTWHRPIGSARRVMGQEHCRTSSQVRNAPMRWAQGQPPIGLPDPPGNPTARGHLGATGPGTHQRSQGSWCVPQQRASPHSRTSCPRPPSLESSSPAPTTKGARGLPLSPLTWVAVGSSRAGTRPTEEEEEDRHEEGARSCHGGC